MQVYIVGMCVVRSMDLYYVSYGGGQTAMMGFGFSHGTRRQVGTSLR